MKKFIFLGALAMAGCSTFTPVSTGKDTYLIEGGVGLVAATFTVMATKANQFCDAKGLKMTVQQWSPWVPGRDPPRLQFSCAVEASPSHLRPDRGITN